MIQSNPIYAFLMQMGAIQERTLLKSFLKAFLSAEKDLLLLVSLGFGEVFL